MTALRTLQAGPSLGAREWPPKGRPTAPSPFPSTMPPHLLPSEKINIRVLDPFTIKPLDRKLILDSARATKGRILTVEDHYYEGNRAWAREPGGQGRARGHRAGHPFYIPAPQWQLWPRNPDVSLGAAGTCLLGVWLGLGPSELSGAAIASCSPCPPGSQWGFRSHAKSGKGGL